MPLPALTNLDPADTNKDYEQLILARLTRDVVGGFTLRPEGKRPEGKR